MMTGTQELRYAAAPGLTWMVQRRGLLLLDELARHSETLAYPAAAIWELLATGRTVAQAAEFLALILQAPPQAAREQVVECLSRWQQAGWLVALPEDTAP